MAGLPDDDNKSATWRIGVHAITITAYLRCMHACIICKLKEDEAGRGPGTECWSHMLFVMSEPIHACIVQIRCCSRVPSYHWLTQRSFTWSIGSKTLHGWLSVPSTLLCPCFPSMHARSIDSCQTNTTVSTNYVAVTSNRSPSLDLAHKLQNKSRSIGM